MSKQIGIIKLQGKLGDISFYKRNGVDSARLSGGVSKERIQSDPKFQRTRENVAEFGGLAQSVKSFRAAVAKGMWFKDATVGPRLTKIFRAIMKRSEGIRGQRPVLLSKERSFLQGLELKSGTELGAILNAPFTIRATGQNNVSTTIEVTSDMVKAPGNATHFRLVQLLGSVADTVYDEASEKYQPATPGNGLSEVTFSDYALVRSTNPLNFTLTTQITFPQEADVESLSVIHGIGIVFYEKIGDGYYSLAQNTALKIVGVM